MKVRLIHETDIIHAGDTLYDKAPNTTSFTKILVERVTPTGRIVANGLTYSKEGDAIGDPYKRLRLYKAV